MLKKCYRADRPSGLFQHIEAASISVTGYVYLFFPGSIFEFGSYVQICTSPLIGLGF